MMECKAPKCDCEGIPQWHKSKYDRQVSAQKVPLIMEEVLGEYEIAAGRFGKFASRHEGIAIIEEEFLEFRDAAMWPHKLKEGDDSAYTEAKQLAAMAIRYMVDVGRE